MRTGEKLIDTNVSRRKFINLTAGTFASIPVVRGMFRVPSAQAQEADSVVQPQGEEDFGKYPLSWESTTLYVLSQSEVGFYVVDTTDSTGKRKVAGAHVIVENENGLSVEGTTNSDGVCTLDIATLADNPDNKPVEELEFYEFFGNVYVQKDGWREFMLSRIPIEGNKAVRVPTRPMTDGLPYPYTINIALNDILYAEKQFRQFKDAVEDIKYYFDIEFRNVEPGTAKIAFKCNGVKEALLEKYVRVEDGCAKVRFQHDFLNLAMDDVFPVGDSFVVVMTINDKVYSVKTGLTILAPIVKDPENAKFGDQTEDDPSRPAKNGEPAKQYKKIDTGLSSNKPGDGAGLTLGFWPKDVPVVGGELIKLDFFKFAGLSVNVNPAAQYIITWKSRTWGAKKKWSLKSDNSFPGAWCDDWAYKRGLKNGWTMTPVKDFAWEWADKYREAFGGVPSYNQDKTSDKPYDGTDPSIFGYDPYSGANHNNGVAPDDKRKKGSWKEWREYRNARNAPQNNENNPENQENGQAIGQNARPGWFKNNYFSTNFEVKVSFDVVLMVKFSESVKNKMIKDKDGNDTKDEEKDANGNPIPEKFKRKSQGSVAFHGTLELSYGGSWYFFIMALPLTINFNISFTAVVTYAQAIYREDSRPWSKGGESDWDSMNEWVRQFYQYESDWANSGLSFSATLKVSVFIGAGLKGLGECGLKGSGALKVFVGWTFGVNNPGDPNQLLPFPHFMAGYDWDVSLVVKALVLSKSWKLWEGSKWFVDNWEGKKVEAQADDVAGLIADSRIGEVMVSPTQIAEMIDEFEIITDEMLGETAEQVQSTELYASADEDYDPVDWKELRGPEVVVETEQGVPITYRIINFPKYYDEGGEEEEEVAILGTDSETIRGDDTEGITLGLQDAKAVTAKKRMYRRPAFKKYDVLDKGITPMASETDFLPDPGYEGVSDYGGIIPTARIPLHGEVGGAYGAPETKVIEFTVDQKFTKYAVSDQKYNIIYVTAELRIGSVMVAPDKPRTRIIMTVLDARYADGNRASGQIISDIINKRERVLDWPFSVVGHEDDEEPILHEDFYDQSFDVKRKTLDVAEEGSDLGQDIIQIAVVSGRREQGDKTSIGQIATDTVFSYVSFKISDWFTGELDELPMQVNISMLAGETDGSYQNDGLFHNYSNISIAGGTHVNDRFAVIGFLDRYTDGDGIDVYTCDEDMMALTAGMIVVEFDDKNYDEGGRMAIADPNEIAGELGEAKEDLNIFGLEILEEIEGYFTLVLHGNKKKYYYPFQIGLKEGTYVDKKTFETVTEIIPSLTSFTYAEALDLYLIPCKTKNCYFTAIPNIDEDTGKEKQRRLCTAHWVWDNDIPSLSTEPIGSEEFLADSFAMNGSGTFLFWTRQWDQPPQGKEVAVLNIFGEIVDESISPYENQPMYQVFACRIRKDHYCEPFPIAALPYEMHNFAVVNSRNRHAPLQIISQQDIDTGHKQRDGETLYNAAKIWYTGIPNIDMCVALGAYVKNPYVTPGRTTYFYITVRNDGNSYLSGCAFQMWLHTGDVLDENGEVVEYGDQYAVEKVEGAYAVVTFNEETLVESDYNHMLDGKWVDVEDDFSLAPGKLSTYRVGIPIPETWNAEVRRYRVSFQAIEPEQAKEGGISAQDDENGLEPIYIKGFVEPGSVRVYPQRSCLEQKTEQRSMTFIDFVPSSSMLDHTELRDAPVFVGDKSLEESPSGTNGENGNSTNNVKASGTVNNSGGASGANESEGSTGANGMNSANGSAGNGTETSSSSSRMATAKTADSTNGMLPTAIAAVGAAALAYSKRRAKNERLTEGDD